MCCSLVSSWVIEPVLNGVRQLDLKKLELSPTEVMTSCRNMHDAFNHSAGVERATPRLREFRARVR